MSQHSELIDELRKSSASDSAWNLGLLCQRAADALQAMERVPMTDAQSEAAWEKTFSTDNPFCPCNLKSFRKAQKATEAHHNITPPESKG